MIFFRCDVSESIGWGHLKRCLTLSKNLNDFIPTCFLMAEFDQQVIEIIKNSGSSFSKIPKNLTYEDEIQYYPKPCRNIIIDLGHRGTLAQPEMFVDYLWGLKKHGSQIIIIDGLSNESFRNKKAPKVKAYIQPYWGVCEADRPNSEYWFYGPSYVLVDEIYHNSYQRRSSGKIENILVTFGGADPQENTIKVLDNIDYFPKNLTVRCIVGPSFSSSQIDKIELMGSKYRVELILSPENLLVHYQWADLGICGSGLSRYEAAVIGLPIIFTSIYREHDSLSQLFSSFGTAQYLGPDTMLSSSAWAEAIHKLQNSFKVYENMTSSIEKMKQNEAGGKYLAREVKKVFRL